MAKVTAPLLSFSSRGQIAKTQVYGSWRGVPYARRYVTPANPNTTPQQHTRGVFKFLSGLYKQFDPAVQAPWIAFAKGKPFTDRNAISSKNVKPLRGVGTAYATDLTGFIASPGVSGGLAAVSISAASAGAGALAVTVVAPDLPTGWTITNCHCIALLDRDAWDSVDFSSNYVSDNATPYTPTFAGLATGTYDAFAWFEYTKPDGTTAYSPSLFVQQAVA